MLHDVAGPARRCLNGGERATLAAIAETVLPPGRRFLGADARTVGRMEDYVTALGEGTRSAVRALLRMIDASAYARHLRPFARLSLERRTQLLESWRTGNFLRRTALRALTLP